MQKFAEQVFSFEEKVDELLEVDDQICAEVACLDTCKYNFQVFSDIISKFSISFRLLKLYPQKLLLFLLCYSLSVSNTIHHYNSYSILSLKGQWSQIRIIVYCMKEMVSDEKFFALFQCDFIV